jgi:cytochrome c oxidase subunit 2
MNSLPPLIPVAASTLAYDFEAIFWYVTAVCTIGGLLVYAGILYFCVVYRRGATTGSTPRILGSARLELAWTVIPTIIFFTFFGWGAVVYTKAVHPPPDAMEIFIIGKQWMWKAQYPSGQRIIIGGNPRNMTESERNSIGKLVLPINRPVKLTMISEDVIHSFGVPAFRIKMDVLPGRYTSVWYHPIRVGEYHIYCDQYCGTWHSLMVGKVAVIGESEFDDWLMGQGSQQSTDHPVDGSLAQEGSQLFLKLQCINCHSGDARQGAPVLTGLYGSRIDMEGGGAEIADAEYIRQSILKPRARVAQNWKPVMPSYEGQVTEADLNALVAYIKSLKAPVPTRTERFPKPVGAPTERSPGEKKE